MLGILLLVGSVFAGCLCQEPGEVIDTVELTDITDGLDAVLRFSAVNAIGVGLAYETAGNTSFSLDSPVYNTDGRVDYPLPFEISEGQTALNLVESNSLLVGFEGVMGYLITETNPQHMVAVSFGIPLNDLLYENKFNVKIYPVSDFSVSEDMWQHMQSDSGGQFSTGQYETGTDYGISWRATMTNGDKAKLIVWLDTTGFDEFGLRTLTTGCGLDFFDRVCWRECIYELGWEWTTTECSVDSDCTDPYAMVSKGDGCNI